MFPEGAPGSPEGETGHESRDNHIEQAHDAQGGDVGNDGHDEDGVEGGADVVHAHGVVLHDHEEREDVGHDNAHFSKENENLSNDCRFSRRSAVASVSKFP